jgi:hypothetical protein
MAKRKVMTTRLLLFVVVPSIAATLITIAGTAPSSIPVLRAAPERQPQLPAATRPYAEIKMVNIGILVPQSTGIGQIEIPLIVIQGSVILPSSDCISFGSGTTTLTSSPVGKLAC